MAGKVISIKEFGAFIEFALARGMVHISKISKQRIDRVEDVLTLGDVVKVVCLGTKIRWAEYPLVSKM